jgi:hypothetical protein
LGRAAGLIVAASFAGWVRSAGVFGLGWNKRRVVLSLLTLLNRTNWAVNLGAPCSAAESSAGVLTAATTFASTNACGMTAGAVFSTATSFAAADQSVLSSYADMRGSNLTAMNFASGSGDSLLVQAAVDLDFVHGRYNNYQNTTALTSLVSCSNSTGGTVTFSNGLVQTVAPNTPRVSDLGLLIEQPSTNLLPWSNNFTNWLTGSGVSVASGGLAPDGVSAAQLLTQTGASTTDSQRQWNITVPNDSSSYTASVYIAKTVGPPTNFPALTLNFTLGATPLGFNLVLNTTTGAFVFSGVSATVTSVGNYWRVTLTAANNGTGNTTCFVQLYPAWSNSLSLAENTVSGGAATFAFVQLENLPSATSYIPNNTASAISRSADVVNLIGAAYAAVQSPSFSFCAHLGPLLEAVSQQVIFENTGAVNILNVYFDTRTNVNFYNHSSTFNSNTTTEAGSGGITTGSIVAGIGVANSARFVAFNGGAVATNNTAISNFVNPLGSAFWLGSYGGYSAFIGGYFQRLTIAAYPWQSSSLQSISNGNLGVQLTTAVSFASTNACGLTTGAAFATAAADLNFAAGSYTLAGVPSTLAANISVSNSTGGTVLSSQGAITVVPTNTARISDLGLLIEQASTNLVWYSAGLATIPAGGINATFTAGGYPSVDGSSNASLLQWTSNGGFTNSNNSWAMGANAQFSLSIWVKKNGAITGSLYLQIWDNANGFGVKLNPDLSFNSVVSTGYGVAPTSYSVTPYPNGWLRVCFTGSFTSATNGYISISPGSGVGDVLFACAQVEALPFCTSYIPTPAGASVSRSADLVTLAGSALTAFHGAAITTRAVTNAVQASSNNDIWFQLTVGFFFYANGVQIATNNNAVNAVSSFAGLTGLTRAAATLSPKGMVVAANGGALGYNAGGWAAGSSAVYVGSNGSGAFLNGYLTDLTIWGTVIPALDLYGLSVNDNYVPLANGISLAADGVSGIQSTGNLYISPNMSAAGNLFEISSGNLLTFDALAAADHGGIASTEHFVDAALWGAASATSITAATLVTITVFRASSAAVEADAGSRLATVIDFAAAAAAALSSRARLSFGEPGLVSVSDAAPWQVGLNDSASFKVTLSDAA